MEQVITAMKRYEVKYILTAEQFEFLTKELVGKMEIDKYGLTSIASIYYDTPDYRLIRTSIEKPPFKEKIRLRSYGLSKPGGTVFLELKRKAEGLVYNTASCTSAGCKAPFPWWKSFFRAAAISAPEARSTGKSPISGTSTKP